MASKIARAFLRSMGITVLRRSHTGIELGNFATGNGNKRYSLPYHVIRMARETGDSKTTVGYGATLSDARDVASRMLDANGIENERERYTYYVRDVRNDTIYRA